MDNPLQPCPLEHSWRSSPCGSSSLFPCVSWDRTWASSTLSLNIPAKQIRFLDKSRRIPFTSTNGTRLSWVESFPLVPSLLNSTLSSTVCGIIGFTSMFFYQASLAKHVWIPLCCLFYPHHHMFPSLGDSMLLPSLCRRLPLVMAFLYGFRRVWILRLCLQCHLFLAKITYGRFKKQLI